MITYAARECEAGVEIRLGQVIEKDTTDPARFAAMMEMKKFDIAKLKRAFEG